MRTDFIERLFEVVVVSRERDLLLRIAGKDEQAYAVARHFVDRVFDLLLGAFEPIGVAASSASIDRDTSSTNITSMPFCGTSCQTLPQRTSTQRHDQHGHRGGEERRAERCAERVRCGGSSRGDEVRGGKSRSCAAAGDGGKHCSGHAQRDQPQPMQLAQVSEVNIHRNLLEDRILVKFAEHKYYSSSTRAASRSPAR